MQLPGRKRRTGNLAAGRGFPIGVRYPEVGVIERVESIQADLELVVLHVPKKTLDSRMADGPATCPDCKIVMTRYNWNNRDVYIDNCKKCKGRWFDGGEIRGNYEILRSRT